MAQCGCEGRCNEVALWRIDQGADDGWLLEWEWVRCSCGVACRVMSLRSGGWLNAGLYGVLNRSYPLIRFPMTKYERADLHPPNRWVRDLEGCWLAIEAQYEKS